MGLQERDGESGEDPVSGWLPALGNGERSCKCAVN